MTPPESTTWTVHLAARRPARAVAAVGIILCALAAVELLHPPLFVLLLAALVLVGSIAEFLFPVTYTLDADGAHMRHLGSHRIIPWERVRRVYLAPDGIKLSPLITRGWVESYRGVLLRTPERDAVLAQVRAWLEDNGIAADVVDG